MVIDTQNWKSKVLVIIIIASTYTQVRITLNYQRKFVEIHLPIAHHVIIYDCTNNIWVVLNFQIFE